MSHYFNENKSILVFTLPNCIECRNFNKEMKLINEMIEPLIQSDNIVYKTINPRRLTKQIDKDFIHNPVFSTNKGIASDIDDPDGYGIFNIGIPGKERQPPLVFLRNGNKYSIVRYKGSNNPSSFLSRISDAIYAVFGYTCMLKWDNNVIPSSISPSTSYIVVYNPKIPFFKYDVTCWEKYNDLFTSGSIENYIFSDSLIQVFLTSILMEEEIRHNICFFTPEQFYQYTNDIRLYELTPRVYPVLSTDLLTNTTICTPPLLFMKCLNIIK